MYGKYTLNETASRIGVTPAWINRVQRETGIGGEVGKKGRRASFSDETVEIFREVKVLRLLGFSFQNIKRLYELEENALKLEQALAREYALTTISKSKIPLIMHPKEIVAIGPLFLTDVDKKTQEQLYKQKNVGTYVTYVNDLISTAREIAERKKAFMNDVEDVIELVKTITDKFPA